MLIVEPVEKMDLKVNSMTKVAVLLSLLKHPMHGYALMDAVEATAGIRPGPAQIYPLLSLLAKKHLVTASKKGERDRTEYSLTPAGKEFVAGLVLKMGILLEGSLDSNLVKCTLCECKMFGKAYVRKIGSRTYPFCCSNCADCYERKRSKKEK